MDCTYSAFQHLHGTLEHFINSPIHTHTFTHTLPLQKFTFFPNFDSLLQIKHFELWMGLLQRCSVAVVLEKMPICQNSFCPPSLRTSHSAASVYLRGSSDLRLLETSRKKRSSRLFFEDETQLWISSHIDSISSLLFFFCFFVAGAHYMLWFTLVQLCFHGSCSTNHRVWLFAERPNSFTSARNSVPFHPSAL